MKIATCIAISLLVAFATAHQAQVFEEVTLLHESSHHDKIFTALPNNAHYNTFGETVTNDKFGIQFSALASSDVHVALMCGEKARTEDAYEIVLGGWGNTRSVIRKGTQGEPLAVHNGVQVNARVMKAYWIEYDNGFLGVYSSPQGEPIMSSKVDKLPCDELTVAFGAWNTPVHFQHVKYTDKRDKTYKAPVDKEGKQLKQHMQNLDKEIAERFKVHQRFLAERRQALMNKAAASVKRGKQAAEAAEDAAEAASESAPKVMKQAQVSDVAIGKAKVAYGVARDRTASSIKAQQVSLQHEQKAEAAAEVAEDHRRIAAEAQAAYKRAQAAAAAAAAEAAKQAKISEAKAEEARQQKIAAAKAKARAAIQLNNAKKAVQKATYSNGQVAMQSQKAKVQAENAHKAALAAHQTLTVAENLVKEAKQNEQKLAERKQQAIEAEIAAKDVAAAATARKFQMKKAHAMAVIRAERAKAAYFKAKGMADAAYAAHQAAVAAAKRARSSANTTEKRVDIAQAAVAKLGGKKKKDSDDE